MKVWTSPYQLRRPEGKPRTGALLKVEFESGLIGYADCHPWIEFGDPPLEEQLALLRKGVQTRLMRRSLEYARLDADARREKKGWFDHLLIPESRALLPRMGPVDAWLERGFRSFKFKIQSPIEPFLHPLEKLVEQGLEICLDANGRLSNDEFERLFDLFPQILYEDPMPFDLGLWQMWQEKGARLAADKNVEMAISHPESAGTLVLKPAIQDPEILSDARNQTIFITSYLDHPVGQLCAAFTAAQFAPDSLCGIATHHCYDLNQYSELLGNMPRLNSAPGKGVGFDQFLENEKWEVVLNI